MTQLSLFKEPVFDKDVPIPRKGKAVYYDDKKAYIVGQAQFPLAEALRKMDVGDSCLLSNWAKSSVHYVANKEYMKFQRQLQPDGTVRIWRVE